MLSLCLGIADSQAFAETSISSPVKVSNVDVISEKPLIPLEALKNQDIKLSDIPTIQEFNEKVKEELNVSRDNPEQTIDLGNGFTVEASVSEETTPSLPKSFSLAAVTAAAEQNKTAHASFTVKSLGVNQYRITIDEPFSYTGSKISSYAKTPSASAEAWLGWTGEIKSKSIYSIDSTAKDAIADANYKYIKVIGNYAGHIELRFTGTGNYYMHNTYIGDSKQ